MPRVLSLDYGRRRTGYSVSDALGMLAGRSGVLEHEFPKAQLAAVRALIVETKAEEIVIGVPIQMDGSASDMAAEVEKFISKLTAAPGLPIHRWDERMTSLAAGRLMDEMGTKKMKRRVGESDRLAATLILEAFLERRRLGGA